MIGNTLWPMSRHERNKAQISGLGRRSISKNSTFQPSPEAFASRSAADGYRHAGSGWVWHQVISLSSKWSRCSRRSDLA
jgi:hypothetical protein